MPGKTHNRDKQTSWLSRNSTGLSLRVFVRIVACMVPLLITGCRWTDANGTHHLIVGIGFGVITTTNRPGVEVSDSRVLGVQLGPDTVGAGYLSRQRVIIEPVLASNVVISVPANPFDLTVTHFDMNSTNWLPFHPQKPTSIPTQETR